MSRWPARSTSVACSTASSQRLNASQEGCQAILIMLRGSQGCCVVSSEVFLNRSICLLLWRGLLLCMGEGASAASAHCMED